jgi:hypothetical protein
MTYSTLISLFLSGLLALHPMPARAAVAAKAPPLPPGYPHDEWQWFGRFEGCDYPEVTGMEDECNCWCMHWACVHTETANFGLFGGPEAICGPQYVIAKGTGDTTGYVQWTDACIKVNVSPRQRSYACAADSSPCRKTVQFQQRRRRRQRNQR